ncbi:thiamine phosphate synthase [Tessaracoccus sp. MC1756]|uniref:thiamine phosphate synthase n=1 Tax=Tessaracoccus sp. MC1756 TaxID=2760311 RepID=UPI001600481F|nr:thiamine phosphate synthase [Tessaracoccus sp. MC1756]
MTAPLSLHTRLRLARLALVVPPDRSGPEAADFAAHGADLLVLTRGERSVEEAAEGIRVARNRLFGLQTLIAADHLDVAEASGADVVFLKRPGWRPFGVKRPHEFALLGRSIDGAGDADKIDGDPWNFAFVGPAMDGENAGNAVAEMAAQYPPLALPAGPVWFAAGGISSGNVDAVLAAGARRAVVSTAVFTAADPFVESQAIAGALKAAWTADPGSADYGSAAFG